MVIRIGLCFAAALSFTGCAALSSQISEEMAPQISTEVAVQVRHGCCRYKSPQR